MTAHAVTRLLSSDDEVIKIIFQVRLNLTPSPKSGRVRSALSFNEGEAPSRKRQRVMEESFTTETNSHVSIDEVSFTFTFTTETNSHVSIDEVSFTFTFTLEPNSMP